MNIFNFIISLIASVLGLTYGIFVLMHFSPKSKFMFKDTNDAMYNLILIFSLVYVVIFLSLDQGSPARYGWILVAACNIYLRFDFSTVDRRERRK
jgi:hypothetical protein